MTVNRAWILISILLFLVLLLLKASGQENQPPSQEQLQEFLNQYRAAFQEGNAQKTAQLVRENREQTRIVAEFLSNQGGEVYRTAGYKTALDLLIISHNLY